MKDVKKTEVAFITHNKHKFTEASGLLGRLGINLIMEPLNKMEIQASTIQEVATYAALEAYAHLHKPLIVEDAGLFVKALNGFPGVYSSYAFTTIGINGLIALLKGEKDKSAFFEAIVAFFDGIELRIFSGRVDGFILDKPVGKNGFGFDPIFSPKESFPKSFAQMSIREKNKLSHRARAFIAFSKWYTNTVNYT